MKVMIVDDAAFIREILAQICEERGHSICAMAKNGVEAIQMASTYHPDLVLMDLVMPEMNGIDATRRILELFPNTKVIACSTIDQKSFIQKSFESGCVDYLSKPFTKSQVIEALDKVQNFNLSVGGNNV